MEKNIQQDRRKAFIAAFVFLMLLLLVFFLVSLKEPDPPLVEKEVEVELEIPTGGSSGGSSKANNQNKKVQSAENLALQDDESIKVEKGDGDDKKTNDERKSENDWMNMMGNNGGSNGGQDGGDGFGQGGGPGNDVGPGKDNGSRTRYGNPIECINGDFQEEGKVYLIVWVNANGKIVRAQNDPAKSTTGSQNLISLAISAVKSCVYYDKRAGTPDQKFSVGPVTFQKR